MLFSKSKENRRIGWLHCWDGMLIGYFLSHSSLLYIITDPSEIEYFYMLSHGFKTRPHPQELYFWPQQEPNFHCHNKTEFFTGQFMCQFMSLEHREHPCREHPCHDQPCYVSHTTHTINSVCLNKTYTYFMCALVTVSTWTGSNQITTGWLMLELLCYRLVVVQVATSL